MGAIEAGAKNPDGHPGAFSGHRAHSLVGIGVSEVLTQLHHVPWKVIHAAREGSPQCPGGHLIGSRRATDAEINPPRIQRFQCAKLLRDHERRMIRQHNPA